MLKITKWPMPPTSNKLYSSFRGRLVKSKDGRAYDDKLDLFKMLYKRKLDVVKNQLKSLIEEHGKCLKISTVFVFHKNKVIGQKGQMKKLDATNRIKQVHDHLARLLEIDDCYFTNSIIDKATCDDPKEEQVIITISSGQLIRFEDL